MSTAAEIGAAAHRGDPWFAGTLSAMPFAELFQLVSATHRTGELTLELKGPSPRRLEIAFRDGQVVFATSDHRSERLGGVLERLGVVSAQELARGSELVREGRPLGQVLVDAGVLTPDRLYDALVEQVRAIVLGAFAEGAGSFTFRENLSRRGNAVKLPERSRELLEAGLRRAGLTRPAAGGERASEQLREAPPIDVYRQAFKLIFFRMRQVTPLAVERLNSRFAKIGAAERDAFEGVRFDGEGNLDTGRVLVNVLASHEGPIARARSLAALDGLLAFALFEARNVLSRLDSDALWRDIDTLLGRDSA